MEKVTNIMLCEYTNLIKKSFVMKNKEKKSSISNQSTESDRKENLWFFNENNVQNSSPIPEKKSGKHSGLRSIYEDYDPFMSKTSEKNKLKKECSFVVDWQLSDGF
jgi:hypothetical protein